MREDHPVSNKKTCLVRGCEFDTDGEIGDKATVGEKLQLMSFPSPRTQSGLPGSIWTLSETFLYPRTLAYLEAFTMINQINYAFLMTEHMEPFRHLLKSDTPYFSGQHERSTGTL